jgi:hypothetical protein
LTLRRALSSAPRVRLAHHHWIWLRQQARLAILSAVLTGSAWSSPSYRQVVRVLLLLHLWRIVAAAILVAEASLAVSGRTAYHAEAAAGARLAKTPAALLICIAVSCPFARSSAAGLSPLVAEVANRCCGEEFLGALRACRFARAVKLFELRSGGASLTFAIDA